MPKITEIWAYIVDDNGPDDEGLVAVRRGDAWMPLVAADYERAKIVRPLAEMAAKESGKSVRLVRFMMREEVEKISGDTR